MNLEIIEKLKNYFNENANLKGIPVTEDEIYSAQSELGIAFNLDYIELIKRYGGVSVGIDIYSI